MPEPGGAESMEDPLVAQAARGPEGAAEIEHPGSEDQHRARRQPGTSAKAGGSEAPLKAKPTVARKSR